MTENDIYNNKEGYEKFINNLEILVNKPEGEYKLGKRKYYCKNPVNLNYFRKLTKLFDQKDNSYIRRLKHFRILLIIVHCIDKDLANCEREKILMKQLHLATQSIKAQNQKKILSKILNTCGVSYSQKKMKEIELMKQ